MGVKSQVTGVKVPMPLSYTLWELVGYLSKDSQCKCCKSADVPSFLVQVLGRAIARKGLTGVAKSQLPEYVAPHGTTEAIFGISPVAVGGPTAAGDVSIGDALTRCNQILTPYLDSAGTGWRRLPARGS